MLSAFTAPLRPPLPPSRRPLCRRRRLVCTHRAPAHVFAARPAETIWAALLRAPAEPGVYRFLDAAASVLYVGKARRLRARLRQYVAHHPAAVSAVRPAAALAPRLAAMVADARALDFIVTGSEAAALALEAALVTEHRPRYNVLLKDDRRHPYALITFSDTYPRIVVTRTRRKKREEDVLYGPFANEHRLRQVLACIHSVFPLRQRPRRLFADRPCINYDLGRCPGVCQDLIAPDEYGKTIAKVDKLLRGRVEEVVKEMREEMDALSLAMQYERAAECRDRIATIERVFYAHGLGEDVAQPGGRQLVREAEEAASIVAMDPFVSRDVFSIAHSAVAGKVVLFQVRGGKVISRLVFSVVPHEGVSATGELLNAVLTSHYAGAAHPMEIPEEVVVSNPVADADILKQALSEKRGKAVSIRLPGSNTASLTRIVQHNADIELRLESQRALDVHRDVTDLSNFLSSYFPHLASSHKTENSHRADEGDHELDVDQATQTRSSEIESLTVPLHRIEGYDISHTSGSNAVGSMVVFLDGLPAPAEYRRYYLNDDSSSMGHPDDFESIRETLRRRFRNLPVGSMSNALASSSLPDLLVIDGGKGQLSAAADALEEVGLKDILPVISIVKGEEEIFVYGKSQSINFDNERQSHFMNDGIRLLCRIRDESHRTAVRAHRRRRGKQVLTSGLGSIAGLGAVKRATLLEHFKGSSEAVAQASEQELKMVTGIGPALAKKIHDHFHSSAKGNSQPVVDTPQGGM